jgi:hypothetical protein
VDCSLLVRLHEMHVDFCPIIDLGSSGRWNMITREFNSVATPLQKDVTNVCLVFNLSVLQLVYVFDFSLLYFNTILLMGGRIRDIRLTHVIKSP